LAKPETRNTTITRREKGIMKGGNCTGICVSHKNECFYDKGHPEDHRCLKVCLPEFFPGLQEKKSHSSGI